MDGPWKRAIGILGPRMSGAVAGCQSSVNGWEMGLMSAAWHGDAGGHIGGLNDIQLAAPFPSYGPVLGGFFRFIPFMGDAGRRWAALGVGNHPTST